MLLYSTYLKRDWAPTNHWMLLLLVMDGNHSHSLPTDLMKVAPYLSMLRNPCLLEMPPYDSGVKSHSTTLTICGNIPQWEGLPVPVTEPVNAVSKQDGLGPWSVVSFGNALKPSPLSSTSIEGCLSRKDTNSNPGSLNISLKTKDFTLLSGIESHVKKLNEHVAPVVKLWRGQCLAKDLSLDEGLCGLELRESAEESVSDAFGSESYTSQPCDRGKASMADHVLAGVASSIPEVRLDSCVFKGLTGEIMAANASNDGASLFRAIEDFDRPAAKNALLKQSNHQPVLVDESTPHPGPYPASCTTPSCVVELAKTCVLPDNVARGAYVREVNRLRHVRPRTRASVLAWTHVAKGESPKHVQQRIRLHKICRPKILQNLRSLHKFDGRPSDQGGGAAIPFSNAFGEQLPIVVESAPECHQGSFELNENHVTLQSSTPYVFVAQALVDGSVQGVKTGEVLKTFVIQPLPQSRQDSLPSSQSRVTAHIHYPGCPCRQQAFDFAASESGMPDFLQEGAAASPSYFGIAKSFDACTAGSVAPTFCNKVNVQTEDIVHPSRRLLLSETSALTSHPIGVTFTSPVSSCSKTDRLTSKPSRVSLAGIDNDDSARTMTEKSTPAGKAFEESISLVSSPGVLFTHKSHTLESTNSHVQVASLKDVLFKSARPQSPVAASPAIQESSKDKGIDKSVTAKDAARRLSETAVFGNERSKLFGRQLKTQLSVPNSQRAQIMETTLQSHLGVTSVSKIAPSTSVEAPASAANAGYTDLNLPLPADSCLSTSVTNLSGESNVSACHSSEESNSRPPSVEFLSENDCSIPAKRVVKVEPREEQQSSVAGVFDPSIFGFSLSMEAEVAARAFDSALASTQTMQSFPEISVVTVKSEPVDYITPYEAMYDYYGYGSYPGAPRTDLFQHDMMLRGYQQCSTCEGYFPSQMALASHMKKCGVQKYYCCPFCDASFEKKRLLRHHKRSHHRGDASDSGATSEDVTTPLCAPVHAESIDTNAQNKRVPKRSPQKPLTKLFLSKQPSKVAKKNLQRRYQAYIQEPLSKAEKRQCKARADRNQFVCDLCEINPFVLLGAFKNHLRSFHHLTSGQVDLLLKFQGYDTDADVAERLPCPVKEEPVSELLPQEPVSASDVPRVDAPDTQPVKSFNIGLSDVLSEGSLISNVSVSNLSKIAKRSVRRARKKAKSARKPIAKENLAVLADKVKDASQPGIDLFGDEDIVRNVLELVIHNVAEMSSTDFFSPTSSTVQISQQRFATYRYNCRICGRTFQLAFAYMRHLRAKHGLSHLEAKKVIRYQKYVKTGPQISSQSLGDVALDMRLSMLDDTGVSALSEKASSNAFGSKQTEEPAETALLDCSEGDYHSGARKKYPKRRSMNTDNDVVVKDGKQDSQLRVVKQTSRKSTSGKKTLTGKSQASERMSTVETGISPKKDVPDCHTLLTRGVRKKKAQCSCCEFDGEDVGQSLGKRNQRNSKEQNHPGHHTLTCNEGFDNLPQDLIISPEDGLAIQSLLEAKHGAELKGKASLSDIYAALHELSQRRGTELQDKVSCSLPFSSELETEDALLDLFVANVIRKAKSDLEHEGVGGASLSVLASKSKVLDEDLGYVVPAEILRKSYRCFLCWQNFKGYHPYSSHLQGVHKLSREFVRNILNPDQSKAGSVAESIGSDAPKDRDAVDKAADLRIYRTVEITCQICKRSLPSVYALDKHFRVAHSNVRLNQESTVLVINRRRPLSPGPTLDAPNVKLLSDVCGTVPHIAPEASLGMDTALQQQSECENSLCSPGLGAPVHNGFGVTAEVLEAFDADMNTARNQAAIKSWLDQDLSGGALASNLNLEALLRSLEDSSGGSSFIDQAPIEHQPPDIRNTFSMDPVAAIDDVNNQAAFGSTPDNFTNVRVSGGSTEGENFVSIHSLAAKYGIITDFSISTESLARADNASSSRSASMRLKPKDLKPSDIRKSPKSKKTRKSRKFNTDLGDDEVFALDLGRVSSQGKRNSHKAYGSKSAAGDEGSSVLTSKSVSRVFSLLSKRKARDSVDFSLARVHASPGKQRYSCYKCNREFRLSSAYRQHLILRHRLHDEEAARVVLADRKCDSDSTSLPPPNLPDVTVATSQDAHRFLKSSGRGKKVVVSAVRQGKMNFLPRLRKVKDHKDPSPVVNQEVPKLQIKGKKTSPSKSAFEAPPNPEIKCQICGESFASVYALDKHFRFLHDDSTDDDNGLIAGARPRRPVGSGHHATLGDVTRTKSKGQATQIDSAAVSQRGSVEPKPLKLSEDEVAWLKANGRKRFGKELRNMQKMRGFLESVKRREMNVMLGAYTDEEARDADAETSESEVDVTEVVHSVLKNLVEKVSGFGSRTRYGWEAPLDSAMGSKRSMSRSDKSLAGGGQSSDSALSSVNDASPTKSLSVFVQRIPAKVRAVAGGAQPPSKHSDSPNKGGAVGNDACSPSGKRPRKVTKEKKKKPSLLINVDESKVRTIEDNTGATTTASANVSRGSESEGGSRYRCFICRCRLRLSATYIKHLRLAHGYSEYEAVQTFLRMNDTAATENSGSLVKDPSKDQTCDKKPGNSDRSPAKGSSDAPGKTAPDITCGICAKPFPSIYALDKHFRLVHEAPAVEGDSTMLVWDAEAADYVWNSKLVYKKKTSQSTATSSASKPTAQSSRSHGSHLFGETPETMPSSNGLPSEAAIELAPNCALEEKPATTSTITENKDSCKNVESYSKEQMPSVSVPTCKLCGIRFSHSNALGHHIRLIHGATYGQTPANDEAPVSATRIEVSEEKAQGRNAAASSVSKVRKSVLRKAKSRGKKSRWRRRVKEVKSTLQHQLEKGSSVGGNIKDESAIGIERSEGEPLEKNFHWGQRLKQSLTESAGVMRGEVAENETADLKPEPNRPGNSNVPDDSSFLSATGSDAAYHGTDVSVSVESDSMVVRSDSFHSSMPVPYRADSVVSRLETACVMDEPNSGFSQKCGHELDVGSHVTQPPCSSACAEADWSSFAQKVADTTDVDGFSKFATDRKEHPAEDTLLPLAPGNVRDGTAVRLSDITRASFDAEVIAAGADLPSESEHCDLRDLKVVVSPLATKVDVSLYIEKLNVQTASADEVKPKSQGRKGWEQYRLHCVNCKMGFSTTFALNRHNRQFHSGGTATVGVASPILDASAGSGTSSEYTCIICGEQHPSLFALDKHFRLSHDDFQLPSHKLPSIAPDLADNEKLPCMPEPESRSAKEVSPETYYELFSDSESGHDGGVEGGKPPVPGDAVTLGEPTTSRARGRGMRRYGAGRARKGKLPNREVQSEEAASSDEDFVKGMEFDSADESVVHDASGVENLYELATVASLKARAGTPPVALVQRAKALLKVGEAGAGIDIVPKTPNDAQGNSLAVPIELCSTTSSVDTKTTTAIADCVASASVRQGDGSEAVSPNSDRLKKAGILRIAMKIGKSLLGKSGSIASQPVSPNLTSEGLLKHVLPVESFHSSAVNDRSGHMEFDAGLTSLPTGVPSESLTPVLISTRSECHSPEPAEQTQKPQEPVKPQPSQTTPSLSVSVTNGVDDRQTSANLNLLAAAARTHTSAIPFTQYPTGNSAECGTLNTAPHQDLAYILPKDRDILDMPSVSSDLSAATLSDHGRSRSNDCGKPAVPILDPNADAAESDLESDEQLVEALVGVAGTTLSTLIKDPERSSSVQKSYQVVHTPAPDFIELNVSHVPASQIAQAYLEDRSLQKEKEPRKALEAVLNSATEMHNRKVRVGQWVESTASMASTFDPDLSVIANATSAKTLSAALEGVVGKKKSRKAGRDLQESAQVCEKKPSVPAKPTSPIAVQKHAVPEKYLEMFFLLEGQDKVDYGAYLSDVFGIDVDTLVSEHRQRQASNDLERRNRGEPTASRRGEEPTPSRRGEGDARTPAAREKNDDELGARDRTKRKHKKKTELVVMKHATESFERDVKRVKRSRKEEIAETENLAVLYAKRGADIPVHSGVSLEPDLESIRTKSVKSDQQQGSGDKKQSDFVDISQSTSSVEPSIVNSKASSTLTQSRDAATMASKKQTSWDVGPVVGKSDAVPPLKIEKVGREPMGELRKPDGISTTDASYDVDPRSAPDFPVADYDFLPELEAVPDEDLLDPARLDEEYNAFAASLPYGVAFGSYDVFEAGQSSKASTEWKRHGFEARTNELGRKPEVESIDGNKQSFSADSRKGVFHGAFPQSGSERYVRASDSRRGEHLPERLLDFGAGKTNRLDRQAGRTVRSGSLSRGGRSRSSSSSSSSSSDSSSSGELSTSTSPSEHERSGEGSITPKSRGPSFGSQSAEYGHHNHGDFDRKFWRGPTGERGGPVPDGYDRGRPDTSERLKSDRQATHSQFWNRPSEGDSRTRESDSRIRETEHASNSSRDSLLRGFFAGGSIGNPQSRSRHEASDIGQRPSDRDHRRAGSREQHELGRSGERRQVWDSYSFRGESADVERKWKMGFGEDENQAVAYRRDPDGRECFPRHFGEDFHDWGPTRKREASDRPPLGDALLDAKYEPESKKARKGNTRWDMEPESDSGYNGYRNERDGTPGLDEMHRGERGAFSALPSLVNAESRGGSATSSNLSVATSSTLALAASVNFPFEVLQKIFPPASSAPNVVSSALPVSSIGSSVPLVNSPVVSLGLPGPGTTNIRGPPIFSVPPPPIAVAGMPPPPFMHMRGIPPPMPPVPGVPPPMLPSQPVMLMPHDPSVRPPNMAYAQNPASMHPPTLVPTPISRPFLPPPMLPAMRGIPPSHISGAGVVPGQLPPTPVMVSPYLPGPNAAVPRPAMPFNQQPPPNPVGSHETVLRVAPTQEMRNVAVPPPLRLPVGAPPSFGQTIASTPGEQYRWHGADYRFVSTPPGYPSVVGTPMKDATPISPFHGTGRASFQSPAASDQASSVVISSAPISGVAILSANSASIQSVPKEKSALFGSGSKPNLPIATDSTTSVAGSKEGQASSSEAPPQETLLTADLSALPTGSTAGLSSAAVVSTAHAGKLDPETQPSSDEVARTNAAPSTRENLEARSHSTFGRPEVRLASHGSRQRTLKVEELRPKATFNQGRRSPGPLGQDFRARGPSAFASRARGPADHVPRQEDQRDFDFQSSAPDHRLRGPFAQDFRPFGFRGPSNRGRGPGVVDVYPRGPPPRHDFRLRGPRLEMRVRGSVSYDSRMRGSPSANFRQAGAPRPPFRPRTSPGNE